MADFLFIPFEYVVQSASLSASAQQIVPLLLDQDADFELHELVALSSIDRDTSVAPPNNFTFQIQDKTNGRNWSDNMIPEAVAARQGGTGMLMRRPVLLARRSNLSVTFANGANTAVCYVAFIGHKVLQF